MSLLSCCFVPILFSGWCLILDSLSKTPLHTAVFSRARLSPLLVLWPNLSPQTEGPLGPVLTCWYRGFASPRSLSRQSSSLSRARFFRPVPFPPPISVDWLAQYPMPGQVCSCPKIRISRNSFDKDLSKDMYHGDIFLAKNGSEYPQNLLFESLLGEYGSGSFCHNRKFLECFFQIGTTACSSGMVQVNLTA